MTNRSRSRPLVALFLFAALVSAAAVPPAFAGRDPVGRSTLTLPPGAEIAPAPQAAGPGIPRLAPALAQLAAAQGTAQPAAGIDAPAVSGSPFIDLAAGTARVILEMDVDPAAQTAAPAAAEAAVADGARAILQQAPRVTIRAGLAAAIAGTGAVYETAYLDAVQVLAPFASLEALAAIPGVRTVRLPFPAATLELPSPEAGFPAAPAVGSRTSEGVALTGTTAWHTAGFTGTGINVAVYDFGFTGWAAAQASGDLPAGANLVLKDFSATYAFSPDTPGNEHGTACGEIVLDMAPGAKQYLYAFGTDVELGNAIQDFRNNVAGKRVATMSVGYVNAGPYDGTGPINAMIDGAQSAGILWINSTGNSQKSHWSGLSAQAGTSGSVAFGSGNIQGFGPEPGEVWVFNGGRIMAHLEWNDWNAARTGNQNHVDYDLVLSRWNGSAWVNVAISQENQCTGSARPIEAIIYNVPAGGPYYYGLSIWRDTSGGCTNNFGHWLNLQSFMGTPGDNLFWYVNGCNSVMIPSDGNSALSVGATFWNTDAAAPLYGLEYYSSLGPRNAPGGANPGTAVSKPDVVAPAGVSNVTYGPSDGTIEGDGFFGTSAAAPHVAGLAAVLWQGNPAYAAAQLRSAIQAQSLYRANGGACGGSLAAAGAAAAGAPAVGPSSATQNNRYGWGRIQLGTPPVACHTLTTTASPAGSGTFTLSPAANCAGGRYTPGTVVQITAVPAAGNGFVSWSGALSGSANPGSVTMNGDKAVTASFGKCYTLSATVSPAGSGTVARTPGPNCPGGTKYIAGTAVQLAASPNGGYTFNNWSGGLTGSANPLNWTVTGDKTTTANFVKIPGTRRGYLPDVVRPAPAPTP